MSHRFTEVLVLDAGPTMQDSLAGNEGLNANHAIAVGATTVTHEDRSLLRVGVIVTLNREQAIKEVFTDKEIIATIHGAMHQLAEMMAEQFGREAVEAAVHDVELEQSDPAIINFIGLRNA